MTMKPRRVGILYLFNNPIHRTLALTLQAEIEKLKDNYSPALFPVERKEESVLQRVTSQGALDCDLLVLVGSLIFETVHEFYKTSGERSSIFVGLGKPERFEFVKRHPFPGGQISGVTMEFGSLTRYAEEIAKFYPYISRLILPYEPYKLEGLVAKRAQATAEYLRNNNFTVYDIPVSTPQEAAKAIDKHMDKIDGIVFMECCVTEAIVEVTAATAWKNEKLLFISQGEDGLRVGAAVSFGVQITIYISHVLGMIRKYFERYVPIGRQPVTILPDTRCCMVNKMMLRQISDGETILKKLAKDPAFEIRHEWPTEFKGGLWLNERTCYNPDGGMGDEEDSDEQTG